MYSLPQGSPDFDLTTYSSANLLYYKPSSKPHHNGGNITASGQALKERFLKLLLAYVTDTAATLGLAKTHLQHVITATAINQSTSVGLGSRDSSGWYSHF
ncbi:hypothetical protein [Moorena producens]|uniref:hypothetical protein n=1 Tax=Moorena producens TaxID=1155739 RepID=UPI003C708AEC